MFYDLVNKNVSQQFENAYLERLNHVYEKSREAQGLKKRRMFIRMKKYLIKNRLLQTIGEETERLTERVLNMPFK